jgi:hypothetical protein
MSPSLGYVTERGEVNTKYGEGKEGSDSLRMRYLLAVFPSLPIFRFIGHSC